MSFEAKMMMFHLANAGDKRLSAETRADSLRLARSFAALLIAG